MSSQSVPLPGISAFSRQKPTTNRRRAGGSGRFGEFGCQSYADTPGRPTGNQSYCVRVHVHSLLSEHGVDYVRGYVDALKDVPHRI